MRSRREKVSKKTLSELVKEVLSYGSLSNKYIVYFPDSTIIVLRRRINRPVITMGCRTKDFNCIVSLHEQLFTLNKERYKVREPAVNKRTITFTTSEEGWYTLLLTLFQSNCSLRSVSSFERMIR